MANISKNYKWILSQAKDQVTGKLLKKIIDDEYKFLSCGVQQTGSKLLKLNFKNRSIWTTRLTEHSVLGAYVQIFKEREEKIPKEFKTKETTIVVDIGANEGYYTLRTKETFPSSKIIAIEPNPIAYRLLKKNIKENKVANVYLENKAISRRGGYFNFQIIKQLTSYGSFQINITSRPWIEKRMIKKIKVKTTTLELLSKKYHLDHIDILKIDTEGSEVNIIKDNIKILRNTGKIEVEYHSSRDRKIIFALLHKNGFICLLESKRTKENGNLFFVKATTM